MFTSGYQPRPLAAWQNFSLLDRSNGWSACKGSSVVERSCTNPGSIHKSTVRNVGYYNCMKPFVFGQGKSINLRDRPAHPSFYVRGTPCDIASYQYCPSFFSLFGPPPNSFLADFALFPAKHIQTSSFTSFCQKLIHVVQCC